MDIPAETVDGNDVLAVEQAARELAARVRSGRGPQFLHALTYRVKGHVSVDPASYRKQSEVDGALESDPLKLAAAKLAALGVAAARIAEIEAQARVEIDAAGAVARAAPFPAADAAFTDVQDTGAGQWL